MAPAKIKAAVLKKFIDGKTSGGLLFKIKKLLYYCVLGVFDFDRFCRVYEA